jgi:hypothetical protein
MTPAQTLAALKAERVHHTDQTLPAYCKITAELREEIVKLLSAPSEANAAVDRTMPDNPYRDALEKALAYARETARVAGNGEMRREQGCARDIADHIEALMKEADSPS